jgi:hypothetical protein
MVEKLQQPYFVYNVGLRFNVFVFWFVFLFSMVEKLQQPYFVESVNGVHKDVASIVFT